MIDRLRRWGPFLIVVFAAIVSVMRSKPPEDLRAANDNELAGMFKDIAYGEPNMRRDAVKDFPTDPWSQDDAYFNLEQQRARNLAAGRKVRFSDGLRAIDFGLHKHLPGSDGMRKGIEPCRPRPIY